MPSGGPERAGRAFRSRIAAYQEKFFMTFKTNLQPIAAATLLFAACAPTSFAQSGEGRSDSTEFNRHLAEQYRALSAVEREQGDNRDAEAYAARADAASSGHATEPESVENRAAFLDEKYVAELTSARERLVGALGKTAASLAPQSTARAQSSYDCWLEQASEDLQPDHIAACRDAFMTAIAATESALETPAVAEEPPAPTPTPSTSPAPIEHHVFFGFDDASITPEATRVLEDVKTALDGEPATRIRIVGWASTIGTDEYNQRLSARRAEAVRSELIRIGVSADTISVDPRGENDLPVPTPDGVDEPRNRQVKVTVQR
jgi:OOP family OmpA-OmpF porin